MWRVAAVVVVAGCTSMLGLSGVESSDKDRDGIEDAADNCVTEYNPDQSNIDGDDRGDACDDCFSGDLTDADADGIPDGCDGCVANGIDEDKDDIPDNCDTCIDPNNQCSPCFGADSDNDGIPNNCDICNAGVNTDSDSDGIPDACDACKFSATDSDNDGLQDACDTCPLGVSDADQDGVQEGSGPGCDTCNGDNHDEDGDGMPDCTTGCLIGHFACRDVCPMEDTGQSDVDNDGVGDTCDPGAGAHRMAFDGFGTVDPRWFITGSGWVIANDAARILTIQRSDRSLGFSPGSPVQVQTLLTGMAGENFGLFLSTNPSPYLGTTHIRCQIGKTDTLEVIELATQVRQVSSTGFSSPVSAAPVHLTLEVRQLANGRLEALCVGRQSLVGGDIISVMLDEVIGTWPGYAGIGVSSSKAEFRWFAHTSTSVE